MSGFGVTTRVISEIDDTDSRDERRIIVPVKYFISQPFENWSVKDARIMKAITHHPSNKRLSHPRVSRHGARRHGLTGDYATKHMALLDYRLANSTTEPLLPILAALETMDDLQSV